MSTNLAILKERPALIAEPDGRGTFQVFSTCPSLQGGAGHYIDRVAEVARWSERAGCAGILIQNDNSMVDSWQLAQIVIRATESLCPLVSVQPVHMHPFTVAKIVSSLAFLYGRRVYLNMVAGGYQNDLAALGDLTPYDSRFQRMVEYAGIIRSLIESESPVTVEGRFYGIKDLTLSPGVPPKLRPGILVSGSSPAGRDAAEKIGATAVCAPEPPGQAEADSAGENTPCALKIGIITRPHEQQAWAAAFELFPEDRDDQLTFPRPAKVAESIWQKGLSAIGKPPKGVRDTYWLHPFENYQTSSPYLVGSYENVAEQLCRYAAQGYRSFILDIPPLEEEFGHIARVFEIASIKLNS